MKLSITSLKGLEFDGEVVSVNLKTTSGEITVLDNHRPLITALTKGEAVVIKKDGDKLNFNIESGFLEVSGDNQATLLAN
ncbi:MAG: F0F1 ATP synthase subunit epsilon [bacterium]|nr:F0F1 ATP synthase subunit epsilon [bacterium]